MSSLMFSILAFFVVLISGGSLYRKGKITKGTYGVLLAIIGAIVIATAVLAIMADRRATLGSAPALAGVFAAIR